MEVEGNIEAQPEKHVGALASDVELAASAETSEDLKKPIMKKEPTDVDDYDMEKYPVREFEFKLSFMEEKIAFNPVVSLIGIAILWGVSIWCMLDPEGSNKELGEWRSSVTLYFTWLFMGSKCAFFFFLLYTTIKFGHIKLGEKDEEPEFSTGSYFAMIFAAGVAVGLFVYGVAEPLWHQNSHFYANAGYHSQDEIDMFALNMTITDWAIGAWAPYLVVAVGMGLAGFRFNLPMTFRSCFYPILGSYTWGWIGDVIDGFAIVVTVAGVCTSLGLGAIQMVAGFKSLGWVDEDASEDTLQNVQILTIWGVTVIATISVMSGLHAGVKFLSQLALALGMVLTMLVFIMDDSKFLLNLIVQEVGYYFQWSIFQLNFWTDAFGQLREGSGRATDGKAAAVWWMDAWMLFYQAWWVSWSCFVGLFVARISRGRTVGEVIIYALVAPVMYCMLWFGIWGGIGLRQARQALELDVLGATSFNNSEHFLVAGSTVCYDVPQSNLYDESGGMIFTNYLPGVTPVCKFDSSDSTAASFNVLNSYSFPDSSDTGFGPTLTLLFIVALAIYFATSSDSGSLVVDHLSCNGRKDHHWFQRLFWAVTEGAVATALLGAGGSNALQALQAASIISGLPFCFFLMYILQSIYLMCQRATETEEMEYHLDPTPEFATPVYGGIFNIGEWVCSLGSVHPARIEKGMHQPSMLHIVEFIKGILVPFFSLYQVLAVAYPKTPMSNMAATALYGFMYLAWIALFITYGSVPGVKAWAWTAFFITGFTLTVIRGGFRARYNLRSNMLGDWVASTFLWPQVLMQMREHMIEAGEPKDEDA